MLMRNFTPQLIAISKLLREDSKPDLGVLVFDSTSKIQADA
jgi:hypothetical protein